MSSPNDKAPASSGEKKKPMDLIARGVKRPTPVGSTIFVGLRTLDPLLQYQILRHGWGTSALQKAGLEILPAGLPTATGTFIDAIGLSPYRLVLLAMATGSSVKQIYWLLGISQEEFPPSAATAVGIYNTVFNSINSLLFTCALTSGSTYNGGTFPQVPFIVGSALYVVGITIETVAEIQRAQFKRDPKNKGQCYNGGLWSWARHINYGGYSLWRTGYSLAAGGWPWALVVMAWLSLDFNLRAVPVLDGYCSERYGEQWAEFKRKTPYQFLPFIY
ncbi:hypothetical protein LTS18_002132 [Coniosporium uncinatum]|uniref:Uncharacterized protein n=1 Tax=Coniosporium uncinatum TaxID=93489 RepID=A0ACC3DUY5_9PEZI|nr:hypothetical protein LTS18_002132 [Coniosporium uncinatum]